MKLDDLMCLCTLLFLIYCIIDNIYSSYYYKKPELTKSIYLTDFINKFKEKFNVFIPNKNKNKENIYDKNILYQDIKNLLKNNFKHIGKIEIREMNINARLYNKVKYLEINAILCNEDFKKKIYLEIAYISPKEYHIIKMKTKKIKNNYIPAIKYRKSKFYNKWII